MSSETVAQTSTTIDKSYLDRPVFICGHRKTGTTMLISLFDNADDAIVVPDDSGMFYLYYPRHATDQYSDDEKKERLAEVVANENMWANITKVDHDPDTRAKITQQHQEFVQRIKDYQEAGFSFKDIFKHFIDSYQQSFFADRNPKVWIEKTTSTEIYALELAKMFPEAKFIHLLRDPRDNWASLCSGWEDRYKDYNDELNRLKQSMIERGRFGMEMADYNQQTIGDDRYHIIRFEDVTADPENRMQELAEFIGIEYNKNLLHPTILGYQWGGNNFEGKKFDKPSAENVNKWKKRISDEDAQLIEFHFRDLMQKYDYELCYSLEDSQQAAIDHYKWFNFSTRFSAK